METGRNRVLIVDDEENVSALLKQILQRKGLEVDCASTGEEALEKLETDIFAVVLSDLKMPGMSGLDLLTRGKTLNPNIPFIMLTGFATVQSAVEAMREGAYDYLIKPVDAEALVRTVEKALELHRLQLEVAQLRSRLELDAGFQQIVGRSKPMRAIFRLVRTVAKSHATILIQGEPGTGKELLARALHQNSARSSGPFMTVDCGSLPETLLESALFGHVRGAFAGAINTRKGLFAEAHGGTILLDEIADTTIAFQSKLLRALEEKEIRPLGSNKAIKVDVRVIAATNKDLQDQIEKKLFREDLFYRLAVVLIRLPSLRERREDIPALVEHFIKKHSQENDIEPKKVSPEGMRLLMDYEWPGNVRELGNLIARALLISSGPEISPEFLFALKSDGQIHDSENVSLSQATKSVLQNLERQKILDALQKMKGNRSRAARFLGISRAAFYKKLRFYDLGTPDA